MGMMLRRYHAARKERFNKQEALEEAQQSILLDSKVEPVVEDKPETTKRAYTKRTEE